MTLEDFLRLPGIIRAAADLVYRFNAHRVNVLDSDGQSSDTYFDMWRDEESRFAYTVLRTLKSHVEDDTVRRQIVTHMQNECRLRGEEIARLRGEARQAFLKREAEIFANNQKTWFANERNLVESITTILADVPKA